MNFNKRILLLVLYGMSIVSAVIVFCLAHVDGQLNLGAIQFDSITQSLQTTKSLQLAHVTINLTYLTALWFIIDCFILATMLIMMVLFYHEWHLHQIFNKLNEEKTTLEQAIQKTREHNQMLDTQLQEKSAIIDKKNATLSEQLSKNKALENSLKLQHAYQTKYHELLYQCIHKKIDAIDVCETEIKEQLTTKDHKSYQDFISMLNRIVEFLGVPEAPNNIALQTIKIRFNFGFKFIITRGQQKVEVSMQKLLNQALPTNPTLKRNQNGSLNREVIFFYDCCIFVAPYIAKSIAKTSSGSLRQTLKKIPQIKKIIQTKAFKKSDN